MKKNYAIEPFESPWASPVVLVKKRDETLRFVCVYIYIYIAIEITAGALNSVTKPYMFPLKGHFQE